MFDLFCTAILSLEHACNGRVPAKGSARNLVDSPGVCAACTGTSWHVPAKGSARCQDQMCLQRCMMQYMTKAVMLCHMYTHSNRCRILPQRCICAFSATMQNPYDDARISILSKHAGPMLHLSHSSHTDVCKLCGMSRDDTG